MAAVLTGRITSKSARISTDSLLQVFRRVVPAPTREKLSRSLSIVTLFVAHSLNECTKSGLPLAAGCAYEIPNSEKNVVSLSYYDFPVQKVGLSKCEST